MVESGITIKIVLPANLVERMDETEEIDGIDYSTQIQLLLEQSYDETDELEQTLALDE